VASGCEGARKKLIDLRERLGSLLVSVISLTLSHHSTTSMKNLLTRSILFALIILCLFLALRPWQDSIRSDAKVHAHASGIGSSAQRITTKEPDSMVGGGNSQSSSHKNISTVPQLAAVKSPQPASFQSGTDEQQSLWNAFHEARYMIATPNEHQSAMPENKGVRHFMASPSQDLTLRFLDSGARLQSGQPGKEWAGTLRLKTSVVTAPIQAGATRVEYRHPGITEWYENRREGLEHGFTLNQRPAQVRESGLNLEVELIGLTAKTDPSAEDALRFEDAATGAVARYSHLKAWDADGKDLPARMDALGSLIAIHVDDSTARYPVTIDPLITTLEQKLQPEMTGDGAAGDEFGRAVAISGDTALIGAYGDDTVLGSNAGSTYVFLRSGTSWSLQAKLTANDGAALDRFGWSVSIDGETALIGAPMDDLTVGADVGSAYLFVRSGTTWSLPTRLTSADGAANDQFGWAVSIQGQTALVGAYLDDTASGTDAGSAYVFTFSGSWNQQAQLTASDAASSDNFGYSVALDVDTALVGAQLNDTAGGTNAGSTYVFVRSVSVWSQQAQLLAAGGAANDQFGSSVSLSAETALIAAPFDDTVLGGADSGSVSVFVRNGATWAFEAQLASNDIQAGDVFGYSVSLSGSTALIGAVDGDNAPNSLTGSAYLFIRNGSFWSQQAKLVVDDGMFNEQFGVSVALSGDTAVIGANFEDTDAGLNAGAAYVCVRDGSIWNEQARLNAGNGADSDLFGLSVDVEGDTAIVGSQYADTLAGVNSGAAHIFARSGNTWSLQSIITSSDLAGGDEFGFSVATSGERVLVGARLSDTPSNSGAAYVFDRNGQMWQQTTKLKAADASTSDEFGRSLDIDGNTVVIAATSDDTSSGLNAGSAYVFAFSQGVWSEQAQLFASDGADGDNFGISVRVDASTIVVGAHAADTINGTDAGKAYVFVYNSNLWEQQAILSASDGSSSADFGYRVSISGDFILAGAEDDDVAGTSSGSVYVYSRIGQIWTQHAKLTASDAAAGDKFGHSLDLQGNTAVIGAFNDDTVAGGNAGSVYVFIRNGEVWTELARITAPDAAAGDLFGGYSIALDRDTLLVSSYSDDTSLPTFLPGYIVADHGSVYAYRLSYVEIVVEQPVGVELTDEASTISFGNLNVGGTSTPKSFTVRNSGTTNLLSLSVIKAGASASDFTVNSSTLGAFITSGSSASFTVSFTPTTAGNKTAVIQIASNDVDENPFDITISGAAFSSTTDTDSDGMNDWQEVQLSVLGFDWQSANTAMVTTYFATASQNGLYTTTQVQDLNVGIPLIQRNATTGEFTLTFGVEKSANLGGWTLFPMSAPQTIINGQGNLEFRFTVPDNAAFFRLRAE